MHTLQATEGPAVFDTQDLVVGERENTSRSLEWKDIALSEWRLPFDKTPTVEIVIMINTHSVNVVLYFILYVTDNRQFHNWLFSQQKILHFDEVFIFRLVAVFYFYIENWGIKGTLKCCNFPSENVLCWMLALQCMGILIKVSSNVLK